MLRRSGRAGVHHEAHVRTIDAHPEGHGRHDDVGALVKKGLLVPAARLVRKPRVIRERTKALRLQPLGKRLHVTP